MFGGVGIALRMLVWFTAVLRRVGVWYFLLWFVLWLLVNSVGFSFLFLLLCVCGLCYCRFVLLTYFLCWLCVGLLCCFNILCGVLLFITCCCLFVVICCLVCCCLVVFCIGVLFGLCCACLLIVNSVDISYAFAVCVRLLLVVFFLG